MDLDSYIQYKAMIISTGVHALLLMFELLACDKLENDRGPVSLSELSIVTGGGGGKKLSELLYL